MDKAGCLDELLTSIPYRGCQLKWEPHEPWGMPTLEVARSFKPSAYTSGYVKSEPIKHLACPDFLSFQMHMVLLLMSHGQKMTKQNSLHQDLIANGGAPHIADINAQEGSRSSTRSSGCTLRL